MWCLLKERAAAKLIQNHQIVNLFSREKGGGGDRGDPKLALRIRQQSTASFETQQGEDSACSGSAKSGEANQAALM